jgi:hypothetical protein
MMVVVKVLAAATVGLVLSWIATYVAVVNAFPLPEDL